MSAPIRVLELRSVWGTGGGPDKTILQGAQHAYGSQIETVVCYVRDARDRTFDIDERAKRLGVDYTEIIERHSFDRSIWPKIRALVRQRQIDIVHAHDYKTDLLAWGLGLRESITPMSTAHGWAGISRKERLYYAVEKRLLTRFPRVIAVSNPIAAELVRRGCRPERVTVIPNGIDPQLFTRDRLQRPLVRRGLGISDEDIVIGAIGRLESEKRYDLLLEAFARVRRQYPQARLLIAGEGKCRLMLEAAIARLRLATSCQLLGHRGDVGTLHNAIDLFVQSSDREGTPNAVLEAMAMETPVVATDAGGTRDIMTDGVHGLIVPIGNVDALASAISSTLADRQASATRVRAARRRIENELSFGQRMSQFEAIYQNLVVSRRGHQPHAA